MELASTEPTFAPYAKRNRVEIARMLKVVTFLVNNSDLFKKLEHLFFNPPTASISKGIHFFYWKFLICEHYTMPTPTLPTTFQHCNANHTYFLRPCQVAQVGPLLWKFMKSLRKKCFKNFLKIFFMWRFLFFNETFWRIL